MQLQILKKTEDFSTEIFTKNVNPIFVFHNLQHTQMVVNAAEEILKYYKLNCNEKFIILLAAWFHDIGFICGHAKDHETESIIIVSEFLKKQNIDSEIITKVSSCIQATRMPQSPNNLLEEILCDADLFHLGTKNFARMNELLLNEQMAYSSRPILQFEWKQQTLKFLKEHRYFTEYCQRKLELYKQVWINELKEGQLSN